MHVLPVQEDDENKPGKEKSKVGPKEQAAAKDTDGSGESEDELSDEDLNGFEVRAQTPGWNSGPLSGSGV